VNIETNDEKLLCVIIAGQPELATRLSDQNLRQLKQRIALRCQLRPLTVNETSVYLAGRIRAAGGVGAQVFTREAVTLLHEHAKGLPRTISVIADNALLTGFAVGQRPVTSQLVREVCADFNLEINSTSAPTNGHKLALDPGVPMRHANRNHHLLDVPQRLEADAAPGQATGTNLFEHVQTASGTGRWLSFFRR